MVSNAAQRMIAKPAIGNGNGRLVDNRARRPDRSVVQHTASAVSGLADFYTLVGTVGQARSCRYPNDKEISGYFEVFKLKVNSIVTRTATGVPSLALPGLNTH